ncbi:MAG TPA: lysylphosphatidylglycerol synthase transmembrane domain-containing protein [Kofleriaceae bacterium]|nr:lysylphosphatidylglycerol synthase transmembrane domain-containing protein [Kofleriaceae bacterium]
MGKETQEQRSPWMTIVSIVSLLAGAGGLGWMIYKIGPGNLRDGMAQVGWAFAIMLLAYLASMIGSAATLRYCVGREGHRVPFAVYVRASLAGHAINEATPLGKLGEVTKFTLLTERMPQARAASALIIHNFVSFIVACAMIASSPVCALIWFDTTRALTITLAIAAGVFALLGIGSFLVFWFGLGRWPFKVMRWVRVPRKRRERWEKKWKKVADEWREAARDRGSMRMAFLTNLGSRAIALVEPALALHLLGVHHPIAAAWLSSANYQVVFWLTSFVPMQAGTAEAGAYGLFEGLGLSPGVGVLLEILRKMRRIAFITLGVAVLGWSNFNGLKREARTRRAHRRAAAEEA